MWQLDWLSTLRSYEVTAQYIYKQLASYGSAEFGLPISVKSIPILSDTPQIEPIGPGFNFGDFLGSQRFGTLKVTTHFYARGKTNIHTTVNPRRFWELKFIGEGLWKYSNVEAMIDLISRRLPMILDETTHKDWLFTEAKRLYETKTHRFRVDRNISAQLPSGGIFRTAHQLSRRSPQFCGVESERQSNNSQSAGDIDNPPFWRRMIASLFGFIAGWVIYDGGLRCFYDGRRTLGRCLSVFGVLLILASCTLWLCNGVRSTWGWWL